VELLQRQLNEAVKVIESQKDDDYRGSTEDSDSGGMVGQASADDVRCHLDVDGQVSLLAQLSQTKDRLKNVEQRLTDELEKNAQLSGELNACLGDKVVVEKDLELEKARTAELTADVAHLRADLADVTQLRALETTNRLLREDLDRVESRLKVVQLDNSRLERACDASEATIHSLKLELESVTSALTENVGNVKNLEETDRSLRTEMVDLKNSLTHAEELTARTQTELVACNDALRDERKNVERLERRLSDETTKSQRLEKTVVDLYAELESKDSQLETETRNGAVIRQQVETKLRVSEDDNVRLRDDLTAAEKRVDELKEKLRIRELSCDDTGREMAADGEVLEGEPDTDVTAVLSVTSAEIPGVIPPSDDCKLGERYAVAIRRMKSVERQLRHADARRVALEDSNALLRQQLTDVELNAEQTTGQLMTTVDQLTTELDSTQRNLQQLKVMMTRG